MRSSQIDYGKTSEEVCPYFAVESEDLVEAWRVNNEVSLELLAMVGEDDWELKPGKGKTIRSNFVHLIGVRRMWLEEKMAKEASVVPRLDWKTASRQEIVEGLNLTSDLMRKLLLKLNERTKPGRMSTLKFFAYAVAHEAHHRSQIEIALRIAGREHEDAALYSLWDWSKK